MYSAVTYTGNGVNTDYAVPFPYLLQEHVQVSVNAVAASFTWLTTGTVRITPAPPFGSTVLVRRSSNRIARLVNYTNGATLDEAVLDKDSNQLMYLIQEAFDQATTQSYFSTDAMGGRVVNVADPVSVSDAATKGWVQTYVLGLTASGTNILPLNNTFTGSGGNTFTHKVTIGTAAFDPDAELTAGVPMLAAADLLQVTKGLYAKFTTNRLDQIGFGHIADVHRQTGLGILVGGQFTAWGEGTWYGGTWGGITNAIKTGASTGSLVGLAASTAAMNGGDTGGSSVGCDITFRHHLDDGSGAVNSISNWHNVSSSAVRVVSQPRTNSGATFSGWNRGIRFTDQSLDEARAPTYDPAVGYVPGDYVTYSGNVYMRNQPGSAGVVPTDVSAWSMVRPGASSMKAIGIDFSGMGSTAASRILAAIKLRGGMPILWDSEGFTSTRMDPATGRFSLRNGQDQTTAPEIWGVDVASGDVWINGVPRVLRTRSTFSAHRNGSLQTVSPNVWTQIGFPFKEYDDRAEFNTSSSTFRPNTPGDYLITATLQAENIDANSRLYVGIYVNGALVRAVPYAGSGAGGATAFAPAATITSVVRLNGTTDTVSISCLYTGSNIIAIDGLANATFFQGTKL